ncbi:MAG: LytTR family DNA-binding domain-containing protein [Cytophagales bacterium]|nr:LytTR family DNA-binding domain-containing protein [Cytophagales bacterium]
MKISCVVVDDEPLAREGMADYVKEIEFLCLLGACESAAAAGAYLEKGNVDLLFLDIQMPGLSGIDFLKSLASPPLVILTTAYSEFALEGYALDVLDYLVKPVPFDRFQKAALKARDFHGLKTNAGGTGEPDFFFVKSNGKLERVYFNDILAVEAMQNYVMIHLSVGKLMVYMPLSAMEEQLPKDLFLRVHKSHLVALSKVEAIENHELVVQHLRIPISRSHREEVLKRIVGNNLLRR